MINLFIANLTIGAFTKEYPISNGQIQIQFIFAYANEIGRKQFDQPRLVHSSKEFWVSAKLAKCEFEEFECFGHSLLKTITIGESEANQ